MICRPRDPARRGVIARGRVAPEGAGAVGCREITARGGKNFAADGRVAARSVDLPGDGIYARDRAWAAPREPAAKRAIPGLFAVGKVFKNGNLKRFIGVICEMVAMEFVRFFAGIRRQLPVRRPIFVFPALRVYAIKREMRSVCWNKPIFDAPPSITGDLKAMAVKKAVTSKSSKTSTAAASPKAAKTVVAKKAVAPKKTATAKPPVATVTSPKIDTPKAAAVTSGVKKAASKEAAPIKLTDRQADFLKAISAKKEEGYTALKKAEQKTLDALLDRKLIKRGAKDKTSGSYCYLVSKAGEKHLATLTSPA
jgi:hypothetical protein